LLLLIGCLILGAVGLGAAEAHAATPSSLTGETFTSQEVQGSTLTGTCTGDGNQGSFNFSVSGTAAGPFPGTFVEAGSFSTSVSGSVFDFSSTFTITSTVGTVTGTGRVTEDNIVATCNRVGTELTLNVSRLPITYSATINGAHVDKGTATLSMLAVLGSKVLSFSENFASEGAVQSQCKHGGWQSFGTVFKNQGDCVSFLATGGKNPPSGS
jgi:hypothetical protein